MAVALLFGLAPALRASSVDPLGALKGANPHVPRRLTNVLIGAQMAFCMFLLVAGGLFVVTFQQLLQQPLGFSDRNLLVMPVEMRGSQSPESMDADCSTACARRPASSRWRLAGWAPLTGNRWRSAVRSGRWRLRSEFAVFRRRVARLLRDDGDDHGCTAVTSGRATRRREPSDQQQPLAGVGIVNESFAKAYFGRPESRR